MYGELEHMAESRLPDDVWAELLSWPSFRLDACEAESLRTHLERHGQHHVALMI